MGLDARRTPRSNLPDTARPPGGRARVPRQGKLPRLDGATWRGAREQPVDGADRRPGYPRAAGPPVVCPMDGPARRALRRRRRRQGQGRAAALPVTVPAGASRTLWVAVAGSDKGPGAARRELEAALGDPDGALADEGGEPRALGPLHAGRSAGRPLLQAGVEWGKQNIARLDAGGGRPEDPLDRPGQAVPAAQRDPSRTPAGSAPASPTTRGCSRRTASTPRSPPSRSGQFESSRTTCARCAT